MNMLTTINAHIGNQMKSQLVKRNIARRALNNFSKINGYESQVQKISS